MKVSTLPTVLVTGGRFHADPELVFMYLDTLLEDLGGAIRIVTGACPTGVDKYAEDWAKAREQPYMGFPAQWRKYDKRAGPIRNKEMFADSRPQWVVVFRGNRGTMNMKNIAKSAKERPHFCYPEGEFWK